MLRKLQIIITITILLNLNSCGILVRSVLEVFDNFNNSQVLRQGLHGDLKDPEKEWAKIAWNYFENNYHKNTGLINYLDKKTYLSMWDLADYIIALLAAKEFEFIDEYIFEERISQVIYFLNSMSLYDNRLPARFYNSKSGKIAKKLNNKDVSGWSAVDLGRLLIWLKITKDKHPKFSEYIDKAILRWNYCDLVDNCGLIYSSKKKGKSTEVFEDTRLGYEEYIAKGFELWGFDVDRAKKVDRFETTLIYNKSFKVDNRDYRKTKIRSPLESLPSVLEGLEFNWDELNDINSLDSDHTAKKNYQMAKDIFNIQAERFEKDKTLTAKTNHFLKGSPYFIYDTIFLDGYHWNTVSEKGKLLESKALVSTGIAFAYYVLWNEDYSKKLWENVENLYSKKNGWYEGRYEKNGRYEKTITSRTNALVLESLLYKKKGKLFKYNQKDDYFNVLSQKEFKRPNRTCLPPLRKKCL